MSRYDISYVFSIFDNNEKRIAMRHRDSPEHAIKFLLDFLIAQNATDCLKDRQYVECKEKKGFATDLIVETQIPYNKCVIHCEGPYPFEIKEMEEILATQKRKSNERILYRTSFEEQ